MIHVVKSQQSHNSETRIMFNVFWNVPKNVKVTFFEFSKNVKNVFSVSTICISWYFCLPSLLSFSRRFVSPHTVTPNTGNATDSKCNSFIAYSAERIFTKFREPSPLEAHNQTLDCLTPITVVEKPPTVFYRIILEV